MIGKKEIGKQADLGYFEKVKKRILNVSMRLVIAGVVLFMMTVYEGMANRVFGQGHQNKQQYETKKTDYDIWKENVANIEKRIDENIRNPAFLRQVCDLSVGEAGSNERIYAHWALCYVFKGIGIEKLNDKEFGVLNTRLTETDALQTYFKKNKERILSEDGGAGRHLMRLYIGVYCKFLELKQNDYSNELAAEAIVQILNKGLMP